MSGHPFGRSRKDKTMNKETKTPQEEIRYPFPLLFPYDRESVRQSLEIARQVNEERESDLQRMEEKSRQQAKRSK